MMNTGDDAEELALELASMHVSDSLRKSKRLSFPPEETVVAVDKLAIEFCGRTYGGSKKIRHRRIKSRFGVPPLVIAKLWCLLEDEEEMPEGVQMKHLLWALDLMKRYDTEANTAGHYKVDEKTFRKWVWQVIDALSALTPCLIKWENRYTNDRGNDCLVSVDCTDCPFQQIRIPNPNKPGKTMVNKALYSKKMNGPGLRYEVAVCLLSNDICAVNGPFCPGDFNDLEIFRNGLKEDLADGERVEADDIYVGEAPLYVIRAPEIPFF